MSWNFNQGDYVERSFEPIPAGVHRVRIESCEPKTSQTGKEMFKVTLAVSNYTGKLFYNLVFLPEKPKVTNQNLGTIFASFDFQSMNPNDWVGKVGACSVKHEEYNGKTNAVVGYFMKKSLQENLPAWVEKASKTDKDPIPF